MVEAHFGVNQGMATNATHDWGLDALDALGDPGVAGLRFARTHIQEIIVTFPEGDQLLPQYVEALDALELVLRAMGALEPRATA